MVLPTINGEINFFRTLITIDGSKVTSETGIPLGLNINLPGAKSDGSDVRLAKLDGTPMAREIECVDVPNTDDVMIWYKFNTVASTNSQFWVYWGNTALTEPAEDATYGREAVWGSDYITVWHMNNDPSGSAPQLIDSTSGDHDGTSHGSMTSGDLVDSEYAKKITLDGTDYFTVPDHADFYLHTNDFALEIVLDWNNLTEYQHFMSFGPGVANTNRSEFRFYNSLLQLVSYTTSSMVLYDDEAFSPSTGVKYVITITRSGATVYYYVDGALLGTANNIGSEYFTDGNAVTLFAWNNPVDWLKANVHEMRFIRAYQSANYVLTNYNNAKNPTAAGTTPFYLSFGTAKHQRKVAQIL